MKRSADFSCSLFKLRLKFVQTTRVVCTDFAEVLTLGRADTIFSLFNHAYSPSLNHINLVWSSILVYICLSKDDELNGNGRSTHR